MGFTHVVRDSDLTVGQYAYGAAVFGAIGAGIGLGVDVLFSRSSPRGLSAPPRRLLFAPVVWRNVARVSVRWRGDLFVFAAIVVSAFRRTNCDLQLDGTASTKATRADPSETIVSDNGPANAQALRRQAILRP